MNDQQRQYFDNLHIQAAELTAEPLGEQMSTCDCCDHASRTVWGNLHLNDAGTVATYFMHWTPGASLATHPANFDIVVGPWNEDEEESASKRCAVALIQFESEDGPGVMVIDAQSRPVATGALTKIVAKRSDVVGWPFARSVFAMYDAALLQDHRLAPFLG